MDAKDFINQQLAANGWAPIHADLAALLCPYTKNAWRDFDACLNTPAALTQNFARTRLCRARIEGFGDDVLILYRGDLALAERIGFLTGGAVQILDGKANPQEAAIRQIVSPAATSSDKLALLHIGLTTKEPGRTCKHCGNLSSEYGCRVAGEIEGAPRPYFPDLEWPRKCLNYVAPRYDRDEIFGRDGRTGRELWPEVVAIVERQDTDQSEGASPAEKARKLLSDMLKDGPRDVAEILAAAESASISERTIQRASDALGVVKTKTGFSGGWAWAMPASGC